MSPKPCNLYPAPYAGQKEREEKQEVAQIFGEQQQWEQ
jgi:hypothetical protein